MLVLVVLHPAAAAGTRSALDRPALPVGGTRFVPHDNAPVPPASVTTLPPGTTTIPSSPDTGTTAPPALPKPAAQAATARGTLPANIAPDPNFLLSCSGAQYDDSSGCVDATLQAIANGRSHEGLPPMVLPSNWDQLAPDQQLFVATNLERTARGLPPMAAMATALDAAARRGAAQDVDPPPPSGFPYSQWGSNWAGAVGNPLEAVYLWMYDDGSNTANVDCTPSNETGCWGHRENILLRLPCTECVMGTGWDPVGYSSDPSMTELLVETSGTIPVEFTWRQESPYLA